MKLLIAIVNRDDAGKAVRELVKNKFSVTRLNSQGGFLGSGNCTLLVALEEELIEKALKILENNCQQRTEFIASSVGYGATMGTVIPIEVTVGGATVFIIDIEKTIKL